MYKFLDAYGLPKLNQKEINPLNRPLASNDIEAVIKNLLTKESPGPEEYTAKFYQPFKKEQIQYPSNFS
jgi:hypothetical protein